VLHISYADISYPYHTGFKSTFAAVGSWILNSSGISFSFENAYVSLEIVVIKVHNQIV
jgi:hypothetical protein